MRMPFLLESKDIFNAVDDEAGFSPQLPPTFNTECSMFNVLAKFRPDPAGATRKAGRNAAYSVAERGTRFDG